MEFTNCLSVWGKKGSGIKEMMKRKRPKITKLDIVIIF